MLQSEKPVIIFKGFLSRGIIYFLLFLFMCLIVVTGLAGFIFSILLSNTIAGFSIAAIFAVMFVLNFVIGTYRGCRASFIAFFRDKVLEHSEMYKFAFGKPKLEDIEIPYEKVRHILWREDNILEIYDDKSQMVNLQSNKIDANFNNILNLVKGGDSLFSNYVNRKNLLNHSKPLPQGITDIRGRIAKCTVRINDPFSYNIFMNGFDEPFARIEPYQSNKRIWIGTKFLAMHKGEIYIEGKFLESGTRWSGKTEQVISIFHPDLPGVQIAAGRRSGLDLPGTAVTRSWIIGNQTFEFKGRKNLATNRGIIKCDSQEICSLEEGITTIIDAGTYNVSELFCCIIGLTIGGGLLLLQAQEREHN